MNVVARPGEDLPDGNFLFAAVMRVDGDQLHCGLIGLDDDAKYMITHLAFHCLLLRNPYDNKYLCLETGLDPVTQKVVAAFLQTIAEAKPSIRYAFDFRGIGFEIASGEIYGDAPGKGLTCASFVVAVFDSLGINPLDLNQWPQRLDDANWRDAIVKHIKDPEHVAAIMNMDNSVRIRPEEAVAAVATELTEWPLCWDEVRPRADVVMSLID